MPALVGKGINNDMIDDACTFLSGPCSCQVKRQNPGFDILTSVNWDELLEEQIEKLDDQALAQTGTPALTETATSSKKESPSSVSTGPPAVTSEKNPSAQPAENKAKPVATPSPFLGWVIWGPVVILGAGILVLILGRKRA